MLASHGAKGLTGGVPLAHEARFRRARGACSPLGRRGRLACIASEAHDRSNIEGQRRLQVETSQLLAKLLEATDAREVARQSAAQMTEEFFTVGSTYLQMARKEGNAEVAGRMESVLKIAMEEKNKTLRPEIQLLNGLLAEEDRVERRRALNRMEAGRVLQMNNRYFFSLLERMRSDVEAQADNPGKQALLTKLGEIKDDATARLPGKSAPSNRGFG
eukprot:evm.model.scf_1929.1 EVM.evm.TU.scf_1929.1   scf_1929:2076-2726(+)